MKYYMDTKTGKMLRSNNKAELVRRFGLGYGGKEALTRFVKIKKGDRK